MVNGTIRPAELHEAKMLNELTKRSVLHWGYPPEFLEWEPESITVNREFMERSRVYVLEEDGALTGYYALQGEATDLVLDKLFVDAHLIGTGRGKLLWHDAVATGRAAGAERFVFYADPNASPFYRAMGAELLEEIPTDWPGWFLHRFRFEFPAME